MRANGAAKFGLEKLGYLTGILHDLGKYTDKFQQRPAGADTHIKHFAAAAHILLQEAAQAEPKKQREAKICAKIIACAILGHHAGLPDYIGGSPASAGKQAEKFLRK